MLLYQYDLDSQNLSIQPNLSGIVYVQSDIYY